jgi:hypothetical protein
MVGEMEVAINKLRNIAASINDVANRLTASFENVAEPENDAAPTSTDKNAMSVPKFEDVRAILANKSREGLTAQVRELLLKYGANKLSEVNPADYNALIADAGELGNG